MNEPEVQRFKVEGVTCAASIEALKRSVTALDPEASVEVGPENGEVRVQSTASTGLINGVILNAGFEVAYKPAGSL